MCWYPSRLARSVASSSTPLTIKAQWLSRTLRCASPRNRNIQRLAGSPMTVKPSWNVCAPSRRWSGPASRRNAPRRRTQRHRTGGQELKKFAASSGDRYGLSHDGAPVYCNGIFLSRSGRTNRPRLCRSDGPPFRRRKQPVVRRGRIAHSGALLPHGALRIATPTRSAFGSGLVSDHPVCRDWPFACRGPFSSRQRPPRIAENCHSVSIGMIGTVVIRTLISFHTKL